MRKMSAALTQHRTFKVNESRLVVVYVSGFLFSLLLNSIPLLVYLCISHLRDNWVVSIFDAYE